MRFYNTLTKTVQSFAPLSDDNVRMYSCGPTVYDHIHIGNLASFIYADTLRRVLSAAGYRVDHVMNFTDVDDKTIKRSHEQSPSLDPKEALTKLTREYEVMFLDDMALIGNDVEAITFVRATDTIEQMQELITQLYDQGFAYIADDGVYFSIAAYKESGKTYGQLAHIDSDNTSKARINNDEYDKASVHDFALWKLQKDHEPAWEFELDNQQLDGRPGWHIECSVMSTMKLGQPFDIHTGGVDLIFPHHENEIAQSTAVTDDPMYAKLFFHNEHLLVDGKKMSKSLQNFYTLDDIVSKGFDPLAFRLMVLQSHYRKPVNFTWESLESAQNLLDNLRNWAVLRWQSLPEPSETNDTVVTELGKGVAMAVGSDLNIAQCLALIHDLADYTSEQGLPKPQLEDALGSVDNLLGLDLLKQPDITKDQKGLLKEREVARDNKDFAKADELRAALLAEGIAINDTPHGQIWSRVRVASS